MKSIKSITIFLFSVILLCLTSCHGGTKQNSDGTHTHEDGSVHQDHGMDEANKPKKQESFKVEADSTTTTANPAHEHGDDGETHVHGDGKPHKH